MAIEYLQAISPIASAHVCDGNAARRLKPRASTDKSAAKGYARPLTSPYLKHGGCGIH